jgi:hypothetical protein
LYLCLRFSVLEFRFSLYLLKEFMDALCNIHHVYTLFSWSYIKILQTFYTFLCAIFTLFIQQRKVSLFNSYFIGLAKKALKLTWYQTSLMARVSIQAWRIYLCCETRSWGGRVQIGEEDSPAQSKGKCKKGSRDERRGTHQTHEGCEQ